MHGHNAPLSTPYGAPYPRPYAASRCVDVAARLKIDVVNDVSLPPASMRDVSGDGRCLYRSIAACQFGDQEQYSQVKRDIADYLLALQDADERFVREVLRSLRDCDGNYRLGRGLREDVREYLASHNPQDVGDSAVKELLQLYSRCVLTEMWGGDVEIEVAAEVYAVKIMQFYWPRDGRANYVACFAPTQADAISSKAALPVWALVLRFDPRTHSVNNGHYQYVALDRVHATFKELAHSANDRLDDDSDDAYETATSQLSSSSSSNATSPRETTPPLSLEGVAERVVPFKETVEDFRRLQEARRKAVRNKQDSSASQLAQLRKMRHEEWQKRNVREEATPLSVPDQMRMLASALADERAARALQVQYDEESRQVEEDRALARRLAQG